jgi:putative tryptophan/tyrosine transport system substrate-binding protein
MQRVGVLAPIHAEESESKGSISTFVLRLRELGWVDGGNLEIVYRWAGDQPDRLPALATELVSRKLGLTVPPTMLAIADEVIE